MTTHAQNQSTIQFRHLFLAIRPKTLTAAIVPIFTGSALAWRMEHHFIWWVFAATLAGALFIQIVTNLFNDYIDFKKGADTHERVGPVRVTQAGLVTESQIKYLICMFILCAFAAGAPLVWRGGGPILLIGLVSLFLAYSYTGGPFPLAYLGLGDIFVILFFGIIAVGGVFYLHALNIGESALVLGLQVGLLATVLIAINNLRDIYQDIKANKKTLAVRYGIAWARREITALVALPFLLQFYWWSIGFVWATILPLVLIPLAFKIVKQIQTTEPSEKYNQFLGHSALLHAGFGALFSLGLILG